MGQEGLQIGASSGVSNWGKKITNRAGISNQSKEISNRGRNSRQEEFQIGAGITSRCRTFTWNWNLILTKSNKQHRAYNLSSIVYFIFYVYCLFHFPLTILLNLFSYLQLQLPYFLPISEYLCFFKHTLVIVLITCSLEKLC